MFGFLTVADKALTPEQLERYRASYCGLCRSIRERSGLVPRMGLSYDMCFLVLLLSSLYEPEEQTGEGSCAVHPREKQKWMRNIYTDYAADMNTALSYLKCLDDWHDDGNLAARTASGAMKKRFSEIESAYPRQCAAMANSERKLAEIEKTRAEMPDEAASAFGELLGELFVFREDRWSGILRALGFSLGRFIYIMDACIDLDADTLRERYNPFRRYYGLDNEQRFRDILRMLMGECVFAFDKLPLVQDAELMKNILCFGLWIEFNKKYSKKGSFDDSGPV